MPDSDGEAEPAQAQSEAENEDEDNWSSVDELDVIGDGHESNLIAETLALNGAEEIACSTCSNYEYLTYEEACSYAFLHSNQLEQAMSASERKQHGPEPKDWRDIKGRADSDKWLQAAHEEVMGLLENGTFTIEQLPPGRTPIGCHWVFKLKRKADGSVDRYKG